VGNHNIGFVIIAGKYRDGKSTLLNRLLSLKGKGFKTGDGVKTCTKGIWVWTKPVFSKKENMYIYFVDSEGLGAVS